MQYAPPPPPGRGIISNVLAIINQMARIQGAWQKAFIKHETHVTRTRLTVLRMS
jgi:hypothetical protein